MKKIIFFSLVMISFSFASCKKDHTCTCVATGEYMSTPISFTEVDTYPDSRKKDARKNCVSGTYTNSQYPGLEFKVDCTLK